MLVYFMDHEMNEIIREATVNQRPETTAFNYLILMLSKEILRERMEKDAMIVDGYIFKEGYSILGKYIVTIDTIKRRGN